MAMQLILPPSDDANTYVELSRAEEFYHELIHGSTWKGLREDEKNALIRLATTELDAEGWSGDKVSGTGPLMWFRKNVRSRADFNEIFASNEIPAWLEQATARLAFYRAENQRDYAKQTLSKVVVGPIEIEYDESAGFEDLRIPEDIKDLIKDYVIPTFGEILRA